MNFYEVNYDYKHAWTAHIIDADTFFFKCSDCGFTTGLYTDQAKFLKNEKEIERLKNLPCSRSKVDVIS